MPGSKLKSLRESRGPGWTSSWLVSNVVFSIFNLILLVQSLDFTPKERPSYPAPTPLPEGIEVCLVNTPLLQNISYTLTSIPYLPELLWIHDIVGPVLFNFSLTTTNLWVGG